MTKEFDHYRRVIRKALFRGTIKLYDPQDPNYEISDFQLLLTFAMGEIGKRRAEGALVECFLFVRSLSETGALVNGGFS